MYIVLNYNIDWDFDNDYPEELIDKYGDIYTYKVEFTLKDFYNYLKENDVSIESVAKNLLGEWIINSIKLNERPEYQQISYIYDICSLENDKVLYEYLLNKYRQEAEEDWLDYVRSEKDDDYDY